MRGSRTKALDSSWEWKGKRELEKDGGSKILAMAETDVILAAVV